MTEPTPEASSGPMAGVKVVDVDFKGDSTKAEAERVAEIIKTEQAEVAIGVGGGKVLDTAKAAAAATGAKVVTCPTIASNDSPTSSYTVWYDEDGNCMGFESWGVNPDLVLVDTQVIANGPVEAFVAGMGDALGTWVEADACFKTRAPNLAGGTATMAARAIAELCYNVLIEHGTRALGKAIPEYKPVILVNLAPPVDQMPRKKGRRPGRACRLATRRRRPIGLAARLCGAR